MDTEMVLSVKDNISTVIKETDVMEMYTVILNEVLFSRYYLEEELYLLENVILLLKSNFKSLNDANSKLYEVLVDMHIFLLGRYPNVLLRKLHRLQPSFQAILSHSIPIVCSCYLEYTEEDISAELNCVLDLIKHIKSEAEEIKLYYFPRVDDLGFLEFFFDDPKQLSHTTSESNDQASVTSKIKHHLRMLNNHLNLKRLFAPSTLAAIAGFVVGLVPLIRRALIGQTAPLRVIQASAILLGDGSIRALTLIVGGNLLKGLKGSGIQPSIIVGIVIVRYVALPLIGIVVVKGALRLGLVKNNPLYLFVLLIQFAVPPAMNIGSITQLFGTGESECSVIMLWTYSFASLSLTFWSTFFMWMVAPAIN